MMTVCAIIYIALGAGILIGATIVKLSRLSEHDR